MCLYDAASGHQMADVTTWKMYTTIPISFFTICFFVQISWNFDIFRLLKTDSYVCKELKEKPQCQMQVLLEILCLWY